MSSGLPVIPTAGTTDTVPGGPAPSDLVPRVRLRRLLTEDATRVIVLCAPSGYGKSVLLEQWASQDPRPAFTLLLGPEHNDATILVEAIVERLSQLEPFPEDLADALLAPSPDVDNTVVPRLVSALRNRTRPFVLVLDELEQLASANALRIVAALCRGMPPGSQLALASRTEPPLGLGRLRASRRLTELGREELTMTKGECGSLLRGIGVELSSNQLDAIAHRTEGWPAALYLAGLALGRSSDPGRALRRFAGDDRIVVDYLREEFLLPVSQHHATFLRHAATLERLSGSLCDFALEREGSGRVLDELTRSNMLLAPLPGRGGWYRLHPLLQEMLQAELRRTEPSRARRIHRRASDWWTAQGEIDAAIHHAMAAGADDLAGDLLFAAVPGHMTRGRNATLMGWLNQLGPSRVGESAGASLTAAWAELTRGCGPQAEHWTAVARRLMATGASRSDPTMDVGLALADAVLARDGLGAMRATIETVEPLLAQDSPWRSLTSLLDGIGLHLLGDGEAAQARLKEGVRRGSVGAPNLQVISLAQLALIAIEREDWPLAEQELSLARAQIERTGIADYPMIALAFAASALVRARRGPVTEGTADLETATRLLDTLDHFAPWYEIETKVVLARASARLGARDDAARMLAMASAQLHEVPDDSVLTRWIDEARAALRTTRLPVDVHLTPAELRVLQFLPEHLSFPQIAARVHLSRHTVKSHAASIYRKLGASSRDEAVRCAREVGLLDPA